MKRYQVIAQADLIELRIYGAIGADIWAEKTTEAEDVVDALADASGPVNVRINSEGGIVADALAIYNALSRYPDPVSVDIDGVAYSAASLIAMAGDPIRIAGNGLMMVHAPHTIAVGNERDLERATRMLGKYREAMAHSYRRGGKIAADTINGWLTDGEDHYFTAQEAVTEGLADEITAAAAIAASLRPLPYSLEPPEDPAMPENVEIAANAEKQRTLGIKKVMSLAIVTSLDENARNALELRAIEEDWTVERLQMEVLSSLEPTAPAGHEPIEPAAHGGSIVGGRAGEDKESEGMDAAMTVRMGLDRSGELTRQVRQSEFLGMSTVELARRCLENRGIRVRGMNRDAIIGTAFTMNQHPRADRGVTHTSSDFPALVENAIGKAVLLGWDEAEETWQSISRNGSIPDFRPAPRSGLGAYPTLPEVPEGGEFQYVTLTDRKETIVLLTYGSIMGLTRQLMVNDDLSQLATMGTKQGRAAARRVGDVVWLAITGNPTMEQDGIPLFDAQHNNIATAQIGPPSVAALDELRVKMGLQTDNDRNAHGLNLRPRRMMVPLELETTANVLQSSQYDPGDTGNNRADNPFQNKYEVVADPRLSKASATQWYVCDNPITQDVVEAGFLEGNTEPFLESRMGWTVDGIEYKCRIDCAAIPLDFRAMATNPGQ